MSLVRSLPVKTVLVMAAIVASLLYWPAAVVVAFVCTLIGVPAEGLATFGGTLGMFAGMVAWWFVAFALVLPYVACVFPWGAKTDGFPGSF